MHQQLCIVGEIPIIGFVIDKRFMYFKKTVLIPYPNEHIIEHPIIETEIAFKYSAEGLPEHHAACTSRNSKVPANGKFRILNVCRLRKDLQRIQME